MLSFIILLLIGAAGCGGETTTPTATVSATASAAPTAAATAAATATATATAQPLPPTPAVDPAAPPTFLGDLPYIVPRHSTVLPQSLDIYAPGRLDPAGWPVVVFVHGFQQDKENFRVISEKLAAQGAVVFTIDWPAYSVGNLGDGAQVREMSESIICAVRYASAYGPLFGGDPQRLILAGFSLGAGAGALIAVGGAELEDAWNNLAAARGGPDDPLDCAAPAGSAQVAAFVGIGGPYSAFDELRDADPDLWALVSSDGQLGANPGLIVRLLHGSADGRVPMAAAERYLAALSAAGYDATLTRYDAGHIVPHEVTLATVAELDQLWRNEQ